MSPEQKCCIACGRWGTAAFRWADPSDGHGEGWICRNDRACADRVGEAHRGWVTLGCTFCHFQRKEFHTPERETREEAQADWNAHVLAEHDDLQWTEDNRASLQPARTDIPTTEGQETMTDLLSAAREWANNIARETPQGGVDGEILDNLIARVEMHPTEVQAWLADEFGEHASHAYADRFGSP